MRVRRHSLVVALALIPMTSHAQAPDSAATDTLRRITFLREIVVTGARYPRAFWESPQAMSFVTRDRLREQVPTVVGDALGLVPGVDNSKDSPWEQRPVLRGLSGQRVLVLVDGVPMNSARGNGPHPSLVGPEQVQRVEVVRGPSSVAYGSDALGGVINLITREPLPGGPPLSGMAQLGGSSADQQRSAYLELVPRIGRLTAFLSAGGREAEDFETPSGKVANSSFEDYNALFNVRYELTDHVALRGAWQLYRGNDIGIPGLSFAFPGASQVFRFSDYDRDHASLGLEHRYPDSWLASAHLKGWWQREQRNFWSDQELDSSMFAAFGVPPRSGATSVTTLQDRFLDLDTWGFQAQMNSSRLASVRFGTGLDFTRDVTDGDNLRYRTYYDDAGNPVPGPGGSPATAVRLTTSLPDGTFDNYGAYGQAEWFALPRVTLHGGARLSLYRYRAEPFVPSPGAPTVTPEDVDESALSGSAGVVWEPLQDLHLSANVATGYRQPNAQDLYFNGAASVGNVLGNPGLDPERSLSYDLGLRWGPGDLGIAANVFLATFEDLIDAVQVPGPPGPSTYQYVNVSEARTLGFELEAEARFLRDWSARTAVAYARGDITSAEAIETLYGVTGRDEAPLPGVPPVKGSGSLRWTEPMGRVWVEPGVRWSWRTDRLPLPTPGVPQLDAFKKEWLVADLYLGARLGRQRLTVGVRNLGDTSYRQPLGSLEEPGRSFVASLSAGF